MTPSRKGKEKISKDEKSELDWEEDMDAVIEQAISRIIRIEEARSNLRDFITNIIAYEPAAKKKRALVVIQQTPIKSLATSHRVFSKRKGAQTFRGGTTPKEPAHNRTRPTQPIVTEPDGTPSISPT